MSQLWTMKVTASTNFCYISDRVTCAVEVNIKKTFLGNNGFLQTLMWWIDCWQRKKDYYLTNLVCGEGSADSCYSRELLDILSSTIIEKVFETNPSFYLK